MSIPRYRETLLSLLYPGGQTSEAAFKPTVRRMEALLDLAPAQRARTLLRIDGGFGSDGNINWALARGYQVLAKAYSGKRAQAFARAVSTWTLVRTGECPRWVAPAVKPHRYCRRTQQVVVRWQTEKAGLKHSLLITSQLGWSPPQVADAYDDRGAMEAEIKADKGGLWLPKRRKKQLAAQEALVLLTDLAHNLLAWLGVWMLQGSPLEGAGIRRIVKDLLPIPGKVWFKEGQMVKLRLKDLHPHAKPMLSCVERLFAQF